MKKRVYTKPGDIFSVTLDNNTKRYLQFVVRDFTLFGSDVIRVFQKIYPVEEHPSLAEILVDEVDFYTHSLCSLGAKQGHWEKIGTSKQVGRLNILFRETEDEHCTKVSYRWYVWLINQKEKYVGKLKGEYIEADLGGMFPPSSVVHRIKTGQCEFVYPDYQ